MDFSKMSSLVSIVKDVKDLWASMEESDREKIDAVARRAFPLLLDTKECPEATEFFVTGNDQLPMRIVGVLADPKARGHIMNRIKGRQNGTAAPVDQRMIIVTCHHCGTMKHVVIDSDSGIPLVDGEPMVYGDDVLSDSEPQPELNHDYTEEF